MSFVKRTDDVQVVRFRQVQPETKFELLPIGRCR